MEIMHLKLCDLNVTFKGNYVTLMLPLKVIM